MIRNSCSEAQGMVSRLVIAPPVPEPYHLMKPGLRSVPPNFVVFVLDRDSVC